MSILSVHNLCKRYEHFHLKDVSFNLEHGYIMGFIGANGAGKTTTLKSILNLVQKDSGEVKILGRDFTKNEVDLKQDIGYMLGGIDYYAKKQLYKITDVVKRFYKRWNDEVYRDNIKKFGLDESKKVEELSHGMKIKYALTLALSHDAKLLLLDEPTSGLDPVARDELLDLFWELIENGDRSILFSTHITSDLEKCADFITYISNGKVIESRSKDDLVASYKMVKGNKTQLELLRPSLISFKKNSFGFSGLVRTESIGEWEEVVIETPTLEEIMIYQAKKEAQNEESTI